MPDSVVNSDLKKIATPYVEPIFTQKWSMFAPCPTINAHVQMKFYFQDDSTEWISPTSDAQKVHGWIKASHHAGLVLGESNLAYWLSLDLDQLGIGIGDSFPEDRIEDYQKGYSYFKVKNYLSGNANYFFDKDVVSAKIRFELEDVVSTKKGMLELPVFVY